MLQQENLNATKHTIIDTGSVDMQCNNRLCKKKKNQVPQVPQVRRERFLKLYIRMFAALLSLRSNSVGQALWRFACLDYFSLVLPPPSSARHSVAHQ